MSAAVANDPMPEFVLKGKDALAPGIIDEYRRECLRHDLTEQAAQVELACREMADWQRRNWALVKLPDHTHVPARVETDCCLPGCSGNYPDCPLA